MFHAIWSKQVILEQEHDPIPGGEIAATIPIARKAEILSIPVHSDTRIMHRIALSDLYRPVLRAIIDHNNF